MKRIVSLILMLVLAITLTSNVFAEGKTTYCFIIDGKEICVESDEVISEEEAYQIALTAINGGNGNKGAWCIVNGHSMHSSTATVTTHHVYSSAPRCVRSDYLVNTCSVCGYSESTLISSVRIYCH